MKRLTLLLLCVLIVSCDNSSSTDNNPTTDPKDDIIYGPVMSGFIGYYRGYGVYDTVATCQMSYNVTGNKLKGSIIVTGKHFKWVDKLNYKSGYFEGHTYIQKDSFVTYISGKDTSWRYSEMLVGLASFDASVVRADSIWFGLYGDAVSGGFASPDSLGINVSL